MSLPSTIDPSQPTNSGSPALGDDAFRALKQLIVDLFGFPTDPTSLTAAPFAISAAGVITVSQGFVAGTVSAPSIFGSANTGTGIYFSAANVADITANGVRAASFKTATGGVNYVTVTPASTGNGPVIDVEGSDTNIPFAIDTKGTGSFQIRSGGSNVATFATAVTPVNYWTFASSATGGQLPLIAEGTDTNIGMIFSPKGTGAVTFGTTDSGATGSILTLYHNSSFPAANDVVSLIRFRGNDSAAVDRIVGAIDMVFEDVVATTMDSKMRFFTMNAVNAGDAATIASLSSIGVWTDASGAAGKEYIGDVEDVLTKLKSMETLGVYHAPNLPEEKRAKATRHFSTTAEEFYEVFGLGSDPKLGEPGIAPKDVAWLAVKGLLEMEYRVAKLEEKRK